MKKSNQSKTALKKIQDKLSDEIDEAVDFARQSPLPDESELMDSLYV